MAELRNDPELAEQYDDETENDNEAPAYRQSNPASNKSDNIPLKSITNGNYENTPSNLPPYINPQARSSILKGAAPRPPTAAASAAIRNPDQSIRTTPAASDAVVDVEEDDKDTECGFLSIWRPRFLQPLANMKVFMVLFLFQGMFQGMFYTYWIASISTVEKRYRMPSKLVGSFSAIGEVGSLCTVFLFAHYGGHGHRPRWMALGCIFIALAAFTIVLPETFVPLPQAEYIQNITRLRTRKRTEEMCRLGAEGGISRTDDVTQCQAEQAASDSSIRWAIAFFIIAHTLVDAGSGVPFVIGVPFMHDNVKLTNTPLYYACVYAGRVMGPMAGYVLGSLTSRIYIDPYNVPDGLTQRDPQWIGAWYFGYIGICFALMLSAFFFLWFPRKVKQHTTPAERQAALTAAANEEESKKQLLAAEREQASSPAAAVRPKKRRNSRYGEKGSQMVERSRRARFRDLPGDLLHLIKNPIVLFLILGRSLDVLGSAGFFYFTPKYLENHFRVTASKANMFTGLSGVLAFAVASVLGALAIKRWNLQPRSIGVSIFVTQIVVAFGIIALASFKCEGPKMAGQMEPDEPFELDTSCSTQCNCNDWSFTPVCDQIDKINYFSPCRAGCTTRLNGSLVQAWLTSPAAGGADLTSDAAERVLKNQNAEGYTDCSCLQEPDRVLTRGWCEDSCHNIFYWYIVAKIVTAFVGGLPVVGNTMILFRVVEPELKSLANGLLMFTATLIGFLPGSVLAGSIMDSTCILWNTGASCGSSGGSTLSNCLLYNHTTMRIYFHFFVGSLRVAGLIFDALVMWKLWNIKFHPDPNTAATPPKRRESSINNA